MKPGLRQLRLKRLQGDETETVDDLVVKEFPLTIVLNDEVLVTLICFPKEQKQLAIGFLFSEGLISGVDDVEEITEDRDRGIVWVKTERKIEIPEDFLKRRTVTTGCGKGITFQLNKWDETLSVIESDLKISSTEIKNLTKQFNERSEIYRETGGVHSAALCDNKGIIVFSEDIGRHNVIDKILGRCLMENIQIFDRILITSGRLSSEIVMKAASAEIPIVISRTAPTDLGVEIAKKVDMTLIGFARGQRMNIYSGEKRID